MNIEDRFEILDLISSYSHAWDSNDVELHLSLFIDEPYIGEVGELFKGKPSEYRKTDKKFIRQFFESFHNTIAERGSQSRRARNL